MTDPRLLDLLKNPDAAKRKAAIQALARSKDPEAIAYLERVADYDEDDSIRDIAEKAIVYIKRNNPDNTTLPAMETKRQSAPVEESVDSSNDDQSMGGAVVIVHPAEEERSRRLLSSALDLNMRGQNAKATKAVIEAFKANPNLKNDAYARGVASTATGLHVAEAVAKVMDGSAAELYEPKKKGAKPKRDDGGGAIGDLPTRDSDGREAGEETEATFGGAMVDTLIYGIVSALITGGSWLLFLYVLLPGLPPDLRNTQMSPELNITLGQYINILSTGTTESILLSSLVTLVSAVLSTMFYAGVVHWIATSFLSGEGSFSAMLQRYAVFCTIITIVSAIFVIISGVLFFNVLSNSDVNSLSILTSGFGIVGFAISIYSIWGLSVRIGRTYAFGTGKGCLSILISGIAIMILSCVLGLALSFTTASQFVN